MLKIKSNVELDKLAKQYDMYENFYTNDYDYSFDGDIILEKDGIFIDKKRYEIFGIDNSKLDLLYDLIKADLVEKVEG